MQLIEVADPEGQGGKRYAADEQAFFSDPLNLLRIFEEALRKSG